MISSENPFEIKISYEYFSNSANTATIPLPGINNVVLLSKKRIIYEEWALEHGNQDILFDFALEFLQGKYPGYVFEVNKIEIIS